MSFYEELFQISKLLLAEEDDERTPEILLHRILERCGAERGFVVVYENRSLKRKFEVGYGANGNGDRDDQDDQEHCFSTTLVREVIRTGELLYLPNLMEDPRFATSKSGLFIGRCCAMVAPLRYGGDVYGVVFLENRKQVDSFSVESQAFLAKLAEVAGLSLRRASEREALRRHYRSLEHDFFAQHNFKGIITRDPEMLRQLRVVAQVAPTDARVLVLGETGTGKELIARALHLNSPRLRQPFLPLNCSALPGTLLESELFGHVAGAFTDGKRDRRGLLASAHGGTLFLDEVGEIPPEVQAKLLRFLESGEVQRLGSDRIEKVDVRIVSATHRDLRQMVREGRFREDLYYRLKTLEVKLPPLRERQGDIPLLVDHYLRKFWKEPEERPRWTPRAERALLSYAWPGNIRELSSAVESACVLARGLELDLDLLPPEVASVAPNPAVEPAFPELTGAALNEACEVATNALERRFLIELMHHWKDNVSRAARGAGLHRSHLQRLLARHRKGEGT
ncbi:MAG: sigma 54-interacting transcriptional regulator [Thermoanaerobaculia bacterium]